MHNAMLRGYQLATQQLSKLIAENFVREEWHYENPSDRALSSSSRAHTHTSKAPVAKTGLELVASGLSQDVR
jgi:hypothetical protein